MEKDIQELRRLHESLDTMIWCLENRSNSPKLQEETIKEHIEGYYEDLDILRAVMINIVNNHGSETVQQ